MISFLLLTFLYFQVSAALTLFPGCEISENTTEWWIVNKDFWFANNEEDHYTFIDSEQSVSLRMSSFIRDMYGAICVLNIESISQTQLTLHNRNDLESNAPHIVEKTRGPDTQYESNYIEPDVMGTVYRVWFVTSDHGIFESILNSTNEEVVSSAQKNENLFF